MKGRTLKILPGVGEGGGCWWGEEAMDITRRGRKILESF